MSLYAMRRVAREYLKKSRPKPSPKLRVLRRYPNAVQWNLRAGLWQIYSAANKLGEGKSADLAWADAAKKLARPSTRKAIP